MYVTLETHLPYVGTIYIAIIAPIQLSRSPCQIGNDGAVAKHNQTHPPHDTRSLEGSSPTPKVRDEYISDDQMVFPSKRVTRFDLQKHFVGTETWSRANIVHTILQLTVKLVHSISDPFNHVVDSRHLRFNHTITLAMMIPHVVEYRGSNEIDGSKVRIPSTEEVL